MARWTVDLWRQHLITRDSPCCFFRCTDASFSSLGNLENTFVVCKTHLKFDVAAVRGLFTYDLTVPGHISERNIEDRHAWNTGHNKRTRKNALHYPAQNAPTHHPDKKKIQK